MDDGSYEFIFLTHSASLCLRSLYVASASILKPLRLNPPLNLIRNRETLHRSAEIVYWLRELNDDASRAQSPRLPLSSIA